MRMRVSRIDAGCARIKQIFVMKIKYVMLKVA